MAAGEGSARSSSAATPISGGGTAPIGYVPLRGSRKRIPPEEASKLIRRLKDHANVSYESETAIAKQIGVDEGALNGWLAGKVKPTFQSLLKVRDFLQRQVETRARQWTDHSHLLHAGPPRHAQRLVLFSIVIRPKRHAKV